jgi:hypothetical protein
MEKWIIFIFKSLLANMIRWGCYIPSSNIISGMRLPILCEQPCDIYVTFLSSCLGSATLGTFYLTTVARHFLSSHVVAHHHTACCRGCQFLKYHD